MQLPRVLVGCRELHEGPIGGGVLVCSEYWNGCFIHGFVYFLEFAIGFQPLQHSVMEIPQFIFECF